MGICNAYRGINDVVAACLLLQMLSIDAVDSIKCVCFQLSRNEDS